MSKFLLAADLHIHNYIQHRLEGDKDFRLDQFEKLAHRFVDIYQKEDCTDIIIAGDLIQVPVIGPKTQHALFRFARILSEAVQGKGKVYFTIGNHDYQGRAPQSVTEENSMVTLLKEVPNWDYMNKRVINHNGLTIGFQDFYDEHNLEWLDDLVPDGHVDILINHFTQPGRFFDGQEIDNTRYDWMFFGDIHRPFKKGNHVSIGNPIGHRLGDCQDGTVIVLDLDADHDDGTGSHSGFKRGEWNSLKADGNGPKCCSYKWVDVPVAGEWDFLRMYRPDDPYIIDAGSRKYDVAVPYAVGTTKLEIGESVSELDESLDWELILSTVLGDSHVESSDDVSKIYDLAGIHSEIHSALVDSGEDPTLITPPVMDFDIKEISIRNFRSIVELDHKFKNGVTRFHGSIGAGKTSIIRAFIFALFGQSSGTQGLYNNTKSDPKKDPLDVSILIHYKEMTFRIRRWWNGKMNLRVTTSPGYLDELADDKELASGPVVEIQEELTEQLEFTKLWKLMYVDQFSSGILKGMSQPERVSILAKLLGWEAITNYHNFAKSYYNGCNKDVDRVRIEILQTNSSHSTLSEVVQPADEYDYQSSIEATNAEIKQASLDSKFYNKYLNAKSNLEAQEIELEEAISKVGIEEGKSIDDFLAGARKAVEVLTEQIGTNEALADEVASKKASHKTDEASFRAEIQAAESEFQRANTNYEKVSNTTSVLCGECNSDITDPVKLVEMTEKAYQRLTKAEGKLGEVDATHTWSRGLYVQDLNSEYNMDIVNYDDLEYKIGNWESTNSNVTNLYKESKQKQLTDIQNVTLLITLRAKVKASSELVEELESKLPSKTPAEIESTVQNLAMKLGGLMEKMKAAQANQKLIDDVAALSDQLALLQQAEIDYLHRKDVVGAYVELTSQDGPVVSKILDRCAEMLSESELKVSTTKELKNKSIVPDLTISLDVMGKWINYDDLSGGQIAYADLKFLLSLIRLTNGTGLLILDEIFKFTHPDLIDELGFQLTSRGGCKADKVLVVVHDVNYAYAENVISMHLDENGVTQVS